VVVTVIVAVPRATPVTTPLVLTVATAALLLFQVRDVLVALLGATIAVSCCVPPTPSDRLEFERLTPVTVPLSVAELPPLALSWGLLRLPQALFVQEAKESATMAASTACDAFI
jgi:hypothetical protein